MSDKKQLIKELTEKLKGAELWLIKCEYDDNIQGHQIRGFTETLAHLQTKDIPPELCSEGKLCERIEEVDALINDIQSVFKEFLL